MTIDYATLTASDAEIGASLRGSKVDDSPFPGWLAESKAGRKSEDVKIGKAKAVTVPADAVKEVSYLIRGAAARMGETDGSRIVYVTPKGESLSFVKPATGDGPTFLARDDDESAREYKGKVVVKFAWKVRKAPRKTAEDTETTETTETTPIA